MNDISVHVLQTLPRRRINLLLALVATTQKKGVTRSYRAETEDGRIVDFVAPAESLALYTPTAHSLCTAASALYRNQHYSARDWSGYVPQSSHLYWLQDQGP